jgi:hypothetical protein
MLGEAASATLDAHLRFKGDRYETCSLLLVGSKGGALGPSSLHGAVVSGHPGCGLGFNGPTLGLSN